MVSNSKLRPGLQDCVKTEKIQTAAPHSSRTNGSHFFRTACSSIKSPHSRITVKTFSLEENVSTISISFLLLRSFFGGIQGSVYMKKNTSHARPGADRRGKFQSLFI